jgi:hypothetical protein
MAHYAEIDNNNLVTRVLAFDNDFENPLDWLISNLGGTWLQTSYNTYQNKHLLNGTPLRGNYASIGHTYYTDLDIFMPPKDYESWTLDAENAKWVCPKPRPSDAKSSTNPTGKSYLWNESTLEWELSE